MGKLAPSYLLDRVRERDLDIALAMGFHTSPSFRRFILKATVRIGDHAFVRTRVSDIGDTGETDVLLVVDDADGTRVALMIEDKIGAVFQPHQADRYRQRGENGLREGAWHRYTTCLCAPRRYIDGASIANEWDSRISLESIRDWATASSDPFCRVLAAICDQAVTKNASLLSDVSPEATAFWRSYRAFAQDLLPYLRISGLKESVTAFSPWPRFEAPSIPLGLRLEHKPQQGRVDLTLVGLQQEAAKRRLRSQLPFDVRLASAGNSTALRIAVPRIDHLQPFAAQEDEVFAILAAVERLSALARDLSEAL